MVFTFVGNKRASHLAPLSSSVRRLVEFDMRNVIATLVIILIITAFPFTSAISETELDRDTRLVREALLEPLATEFEDRGFSEVEAKAASARAIDWLTACWTERPGSEDRSKEVISVRLGGSVIVTYTDPCMKELLS